MQRRCVGKVCDQESREASAACRLTSRPLASAQGRLQRRSSERPPRNFPAIAAARADREQPGNVRIAHRRRVHGCMRHRAPSHRASTLVAPPRAMPFHIAIPPQTRSIRRRKASRAARCKGRSMCLTTRRGVGTWPPESMCASVEPHIIGCRLFGRVSDAHAFVCADLGVELPRDRRSRRPHRCHVLNRRDRRHGPRVRLQVMPALPSPRIAAACAARSTPCGGACQICQV